MKAKKNASNDAATSNEADSVPVEETKTTSKIAKPKTIRKPVVTTLKFELTDTELVGKADFAGKRSRALTELEAEFDRVKADFKGRIETLRGQIAAALRCADEHAEWREVMADEVHDYEKAEVRTEFDGKVHHVRTMMARERQLELEVKSEPAPAPKPAPEAAAPDTTEAKA